jgi:hypothetical protein
VKLDPAALAAAKDIAERLVFTFLEAFLGAMILSPVLNVSALKAAAFAGMAAALTYGKGTLAMLKPDTFSPASVAEAPALRRDPATGRFTKAT